MTLRLRCNTRYAPPTKSQATFERSETGPAIPAGETFTVRWPRAKAALAPFKDKLDDLRAALNAMQQSPGELTSGQSKVLGKSFTPALGLPVDPKL